MIAVVRPAGWSGRLTPLVAPLVSLLAGVAHALSFAPFDRPALQVAALAVLIWAAERSASWRAAALAGFAFGLGWFATGVSWVYISMHDFGDLPAWIAGPATLAFAALLAAFPAASAGAAHRAARGRAARLLLAWPAAWCLGEWLRGTVLGGFPWISSGYAHTDGPLAGYAPILGVYGLCMISALIAGSLVMLWPWPSPGPDLRARLSAGAAILLLLAGGQALRGLDWTRPAGPPLRVKLVQGNILQDLKFGEGGTQLATDRYFELMPDKPGEHSDLIVLPESAFPLPLDDLPPGLHDGLLGFAHEHKTALIFGVFLEEPGYRYYNSALGLQGEAPPQRFSKRHLVPFGEFVPFGFRWFVDLMQIPLADQQRGPAYQPPMQLAGQRIAVNICFEDLFGTEIITAWRDPALEPTLLLNLSNLAWFRGSMALPQHLQISRMRALETGLPLMQDTNTGATAIIDAHGRVTAQMPPDQAGVLQGEVTGYRGHTAYVKHGDLPALALAVALLAAATLAHRWRRQGATAPARET